MFSNAVIFADDASILSALHNVDASEREGEREKERETERDRERDRERQRETVWVSILFQVNMLRKLFYAVYQRNWYPSLIFNISESVKPIHSNLMQ